MRLFIARPARSMRGLIVSILIAAASVAAVEFALRTTHWLGARISWSQPDTRIGWRFLGDTDYWYDSRENDHPIVGRTNSWGWNDRQWSLHKKPGSVRVAVLGDSYVEALQVERAHNFLSIAEDRLNASGSTRFELMNFARSGFTQTEEWLVLKDEVLPFEPDLVALFYYAPNDIADVDPATASDRLRPFPSRVSDDDVVMDTSFLQQSSFRVRSLMSPLKNHSALASLVAERIMMLQLSALARNQPAPGRAASPTAPAGEIGGYLSLATSKPDPVYARSYDVTKALIRAMTRLCRQRDIPFLLVIVDTPDYVPDVERRVATGDASFRFRHFDEDLAQFAAGLGAQSLGLTAPFRRHYVERGEDLHFSMTRQDNPIPLGNLTHPGHWNYAGHRLAAQLLSDKLQAMFGQTGRARSGDADGRQAVRSSTPAH